MDRPGLDSLLHYVRKGDALAVVRLSTDSGAPLGELLATVEILRSRGIDLLSLEEKINTPRPLASWCSTCFGAIAHFERRLIAEAREDAEFCFPASTLALRARQGLFPILTRAAVIYIT